MKIETSINKVRVAHFFKTFSPALIIFSGSLLRITQIGEHLGQPYLFRRSQTAVVTREISERGILEAGLGPLPVFGPGTQIPFEFPLFQQLAAVFVIGGVPLEVAGRSLALVFFQGSAIMVYLVVRKHFDQNVATIALILIQLSPFGLIWSTAFLIEFPATFFGLGMLLGGLNALDKQGSLSVAWVAFSMSMGALSALVKVTTAGVFLILLASLSIAKVMKHRELLWPAIAKVLPVSAFTVFAGALWTSIADDIKASQESTTWLSSGSLVSWNFGTLSERLDVGAYITLLDHAVPLLFGALSIFLAVGIAISKVRVPEFIQGMLISAFSGPLIFFNLYVTHSYYLSAVFFQLSVVMAWGITVLAGVFAKYPVRIISLPLALGTLLSIATLLGHWSVHDQLTSLYSPRANSSLSEELLELNTQNDMVYLVNCDWDPQIVYETGFDAYMFRQPVSESAQLMDEVASQKIKKGAIIASCKHLFDEDSEYDENFKVLSSRVATIEEKVG